MRPAWMESHAIAQSLDTVRYRKYIINPNSQTHSQRGSLIVKKENDIDQLSSGAIGRSLIPKYDDIIIKGNFNEQKDIKTGQTTLKSERASKSTGGKEAFTKVISKTPGHKHQQLTARQGVRTAAKDFWEQRNVFQKVNSPTKNHMKRLDSQRSQVSSASSKTRQFMLSLVKRNKEQMLDVKPYSFHNTA